MKELTEIQNLLKVNKNEYNSFGKYKYRTVEAILHEVKPHLLSYKLSLYFNDKIININELIVIKSIAILINNETLEKVYGVGYAGIELQTKGMHVAQCFGSSTSYARKYALQGLLLLDDANDDIDSKDYAKANQNIVKANQDITNKIENKPYFSEKNFKKAYELKTKFDEIRKYYILPEEVKQKYLIYISEQDSQLKNP